VAGRVLGAGGLLPPSGALGGLFSGGLATPVSGALGVRYPKRADLEGDDPPWGGAAGEARDMTDSKRETGLWHPTWDDPHGTIIKTAQSIPNCAVSSVANSSG
jgi:hypothetical protein